MTTASVTGATSFTGRFIATRLTEAGDEVRNLTRGDLATPHRLAAALDGTDTLYNTFWIRFERGPITYAWAIERSRLLFEAARRAGVRRIVHISVINASHDAPTAYFRAKAVVEDALRDSGIGHAIVRPTVTFGPGDILINNLAWTLRRMPAFGIPGDGRYPIQPVHVEDVAQQAVRAGGMAEDVTLDVGGPDIFAFDEFVALVRHAVGSRALVVHLPVAASLAAARLIGLVVRDVVLTRHEVTELQQRLMFSLQPPAGTIRLADWLAASADSLGRRWANELDRHFRQPLEVDR
ncbi:MAG: NAD(P)H-binding protein [Chloroflexota bacterium]